MSKELESYAREKKDSIIHRSFTKGQVNLFHPPKKNPNGHLASAKLRNEKIACKSSVTEELPEIQEEALNNNQLNRLLNPKKINAIELWDDTILEDLPEANREEEAQATSNNDLETPTSFLNAWKIGAISLIIVGNLIAATAIFIHKHQAREIALTVENSPKLYTSGTTDLTAQEFVQLDLNNLKNIAPSTKPQEPKKTTKSQDTSLDNLPLAIPPTNLPQDIILPQAKKSSQYYYILTEYTGDRSLELAKAQVPSVSLVNFPQGVFIYMGAFAQRESASKFVKQMKELGLESYIYPFE